MTEAQRICTANRGVITRYINEANNILHEQEKDRHRLITIQGMLREKLDYIKRLDSEILEISEIKDIDKEITDLEDFITRVLDMTKNISKAMSAENVVVTSSKYSCSIAYS